MTTGPINPKETALAAIARGELIRVGDTTHTVGPGDVVTVPVGADGSIPPLTFFNGGGGVKTPQEAGIARIQTTPKPAPCKLLKRAKREAGNRKYIITKKDRPDLFP